MTFDRQAERLMSEARAAADLIREIASDDEALNHDMVEGETSLLEAIEKALEEIDECQIAIVGIKDREATLADRRKRAEARQERIRSLIEQALLVAEFPTVKLPCATLTVSQVAPKSFVDDEAQIPTRFWKSPDPVLDKVAINKAVKDGEIIPGVAMTNGTTKLTIRRA